MTHATLYCHRGIQCTPEAGDWYGHNMYKEGHWQNKYHKEHYGDPKEFGLKDYAPLQTGLPKRAIAEVAPTMVK